MLSRLLQVTKQLKRMTGEGGASMAASCSTASVNRGRACSTSSYPLNAIAPSRNIARLPLLQFGTKESNDFAESSRDGRVLSRLKDQFKRTWKVAALSIPARDSAVYQQNAHLQGHILRLPKIKSLIPDEQDRTKRLLLLSTQKVEDLPQSSQMFVKDSQLQATQSEVAVDYSYWTVEEILAALLPEGLPEGTPTAFTSTGHIAHLNLRDEYSAYRYMIGQCILEKNNNIRTVVNKLDTIDNEFRFFKMERLAGDDDYTVTVSESNCTFTFDFRTVYWNSRLHTEHERLINTFQPYEVVSDVMAGVGPFAVPAAKKGVYVIANDLNPASYDSMVVNAKKNKVEKRMRSYCEDGRAFIKESIERVWNEPFEGIPTTEEGRLLDLASQTARARGKQQHQALKGEKETSTQRGSPRRLINHFVMNLPGSALEFLDAFKGAYRGLPESEVEAEMKREGMGYPMVHVHCFTKNLEQPYEDVCRRANERLGLSGDDCLTPPPSPPVDNGKGGDEESLTSLSKLAISKNVTADLSLQYVRSVAPNKDMYCLSFRLTRNILFA